MHNKKGLLIDLDGTIYSGDTLIEGAKEAITLLQQHNIPFIFVSNRGNYSRLACQQKLKDLGIIVDAKQIVLTSTVAAHYLQENYAQEAVWVLGNDLLVQELIFHQLKLAKEPTEAKWLMITLHEQLTYEDLNLAFRAVKAGARIIATNADQSFPRQDGHCIDVAGMIGAIAYSTGKEPEIVVGKPHSFIAKYALHKLQLPAEQCIMIGDSIASDIMLAKQYGMQSALVLSGSTSQRDYDQQNIKADWVFPSIHDLLIYLKYNHII